MTQMGQKEQSNQTLELPKRKLGKTGVEIPSLAVGVAFNAVDNQIILRKAVDWGVTTWDTSHVYENGNAELGIGKFFEKNPDVRKKTFPYHQGLRCQKYGGCRKTSSDELSNG